MSALFATLFTSGIFYVIGIIIGLIITVICVFVGNILLFDSIIFAVTSGILASQLLNIHPALSLIIGITVLFVMLWIQKTKFGFWIIGSLLSLSWAFIFAFAAYTFSNGDMVWTHIVMGVGFIVMIRLHIKARRRYIC